MSPIVIYSRDMCNWCTKAKKLFTDLGLGYREIKLNPESDWYKLEKNLLYKKTRQNTFPFIFVGDEFIGGYDAFVHASCTTLPGKLSRYGIVLSTEDF